MQVSFVRLVDARDIAVETPPHPPQGVTVRVAGNKLKKIADVLATSRNVADLDGDGIPEIILDFDQGAGTCGMRGNPGILRWNGIEYVRDGKRYAAWAKVRAGAPVEDLGFDARFGTEQETPPRPYVLRLFKQPGIRHIDVTIDDEPVVAGKTVLLENDCHTMTVRASRREGAVAVVFVEQRL